MEATSDAQTGFIMQCPPTEIRVPIPIVFVHLRPNTFGKGIN